MILKRSNSQIFHKTTFLNFGCLTLWPQQLCIEEPYFLNLVIPCIFSFLKSDESSLFFLHSCFVLCELVVWASRYSRGRGWHGSVGRVYHCRGVRLRMYRHLHRHRRDRLRSEFPLHSQSCGTFDHTILLDRRLGSIRFWCYVNYIVCLWFKRHSINIV